MKNLQKQSLRLKLKKIHQQIDPAMIQQASQNISEKILALDEVKNAKCIALYCSFNNEFDTTYLIEALKNSKQLVFPKIVGKEMHFYADDKFKENRMGIKEPLSNMHIAKESIDVMIVPYLGYNQKGYRIGYGKGYYDRYLAGSTIFTILPAIHCYRVAFEADAFDQKITLIVENG